MQSRLFLISVLFLMVSCVTQEVCNDNSQSELVARFKTVISEAVSDTTISGVTLYGIREGKPDSLLYDSSDISSVELPLDPHHTYSRFVMKINELSDTLTLIHNTGFYLMSYTCGYGAIFTLDPDSIIHGSKLFYDIEIKSTVIDADTEPDEEHLWLYF